MKKATTLIIILIHLTSCYSQHVFNNSYYTNIDYELNYFSYAKGVICTLDSNFVVVGAGNNGSKFSTLKLSSSGDTIWSCVANFGVKSPNRLSAVIEANDGNFVVAGVSTNFNGDYSNALIVKLNKNTGDTLWLKKIGLVDTSEYFYAIKQTKNYGFILSGSRIIEDPVGTGYQSDVYLVKTDSMGIVEWERTFVAPEADWITSIEIADDGGFMLLGCTRTFGAGGQSMYLIKTDSLGNLLWQKTYGGTLEDWGLAMTKLQDGNYVLAGTSQINSEDYMSTIIKVNNQGEVIWYKDYKGLFKGQEFTGVKELSSGNIVVCGHTKGDTSGIISFFGIVKVLSTEDGSIVWEKQYDYYNNEPNKDQYIYSIDICKDGGLILAGMARNLNFDNASPQNSMWVVKTDCIGNDSIWDNAACPIKTDTPDTMIPFNLYPNPSTGAVTLDYFIPQNAQNQSVSFYDATGKLVQKVDFTGEGQIQLNIDCSGFSNGVYQCVLVSDGEVMQQGKLVLIK
jgi:hypothetical protein